MTVMAIDSSSRARAWALLVQSDGTLIEERTMPGGELDRRLPGLLAELHGGDAAGVVVLTGPGSYTGVRAGMAAALGVAAARSLPLHGMGTLTALAMEANPRDGREFTVVSDAGRGGVYAARFRGDAGGVKPVTVVRRLSGFLIEDGGRVFATAEIPGVTVERLDPVRVLAAAVPRALALAPLDPVGLAAVHAQAWPGS